tara:strand:+ start:602 stop:1003 length:402 start_codon:yes stop_codon:yes gene_type:complete
MNNLVKITGLSAYNRTYFENEDSGVLSWIIDMDKIRVISTEFNRDVNTTLPPTENKERYLKTRIIMFDGAYLDFCININLGGVGNEIENALADLIDARTQSDKYNQMKVLDCSKIINFEFIKDTSQWLRLYDY